MLEQPGKNENELLADWFGSPFGKHLLASERNALRRCMAGVEGYHLMQLAGAGQPLIEEDLGHLHPFSVAANTSARGAGAIADFESLPLPYETIDTALLHHTLDFADNPHQVLNEAARVVAPGGHIVLVVFNPYSSFGLIRLVAKLCSINPVWKGNNLRYGRLLDWIKLLGFQPIKCVRGCYQLPFSWRPWLAKSAFLNRLDEEDIPFGGSYYLVVARKQVAPLTPAGKPVWRALGAPLIPAAKKTACRRHQKQGE